jgi:hypothetical protein
MPTAESYWSAAADFARLADLVLGEVAPIRAGLDDDVVRGGRLRTTLDQAVADIVAGLGATADGYEALAAECRRRALACEAYTAAVAAHLRAVADGEAAALAGRPERRVLPPPHREPWMAAG